MKKHYRTTLPLIALMTLSAMTGCEPHENSSEVSSDEEVITFKDTLLEAQPVKTLAVEETVTYEINRDILDMNYVQILLKLSGNVRGKFHYVNNIDAAQAVTEDFFIEGNETGDVVDFRQFFDAFRPQNINIIDKATGDYQEMSVGKFEKVLQSIEFANLEDAPITLEIKAVNISDRVIPEFDKEIYIESEELKVGMDLLTGGALTYLERKEYDGDTIDEVITEDGDIKIGVDYASRPEVQMEISSHVNLINIYDAGRQIQQSYYGSIGGHGLSEEERKSKDHGDGGTQNGYTRNISRTADRNGYYWPYNPVQGGDEVVNFSQIIDFRRTKDELYCKVRPLDWAGYESGGYGNPTNNRVTKSYMENWFRIQDGMLYATNRFIDWNGFYDLENIPAHNIEIPATYISQPLHIYQTYNGDQPYAEDLDERYGMLDRNDRLGPWKNGGYRSNQHTEDWFAWTNDEDFGVAVYIPGATYYSSGRSCVGTKMNSLSPEGLPLNIGAYDSSMAGDYRYNKSECENDSTSCYLRNTSYTAPVKAVKLKEYIPLEYTYVVAVDYVRVFREAFREIDALGIVKQFNEIGLNNWN